MASSHEDEEWDKSTSEIQSEDSDDLHESRPNRWKGPPQSWRSITEEDRLTYNALGKVRNQDLSLHLYNAYKLRERAAAAAAGGESGQEEDVDAETGEPVRNEPWAPPKTWTAWPLPTHLLPPDDFMSKTEDEDEVFTIRRPEDQRPSARLEEIISATTLRFAKERLRQRGFTESSHEDDDGTVKAELLSSEAESQPGESADDSQDEEAVDGGEQPEGRRQGKQNVPAKTFRPVVSTDDDLSYDLIRPSTRRILDNLDNTLTVLHNARMTSAQTLEESEEPSSESDNESRQSSQPVSSPERSPSKSPRMPAGDGSPTKKSNRGRPRKYVQMEGESERDFEIRRARALKGKVRLPPTEAGGGSQSGSPRKRASPQKRQRDDTAEDHDRDYLVQKKLDRLRPRDWSDVLGAAALAGFPPDVVARATQRCANLFGQGMDMHRIDGNAAPSGASGLKTTTYRPGGEVPPGDSEAEDGIGGLDHRRQAPSRSRDTSAGDTSAAPSRTRSPTSDDEDSGEGEVSPKKEQPRKPAKSKGKKGQHFCPFPDCERATVGFDRPFNLKRHMNLVHGEDTPPDASEEAEAAPADDMLDGIHRDGFLQPIRVQKGWRAEDTKKRAARNP
ncbi:hypothetical protein KVR01_010401 [Diaporthe batatas]|uniref:uncharacterized protein n=1 Tax=Diaporthe batatas TaxID=748121 RepID=UPI001D051E1E|nr:uncharacterized protein KVR01_010401 [Diaporthe batatas]KAG8159764.1 hypothetical protein KVR01_010401 [Diaporthe batatas]